MSIIIASILCFQFNASTLLIFTAANIYFLSEDNAVDRFWFNMSRTLWIVYTLICLHLYQIVSWTNPGPCYDTIAEVELTQLSISFAEMALIDINALISIGVIQQYFKKGLLKVKMWASTNFKK